MEAGSFASLNSLLRLHFRSHNCLCICKLCETVSAFKYCVSAQFIEQQSPLGIKTFSQEIYTKQLSFGVFKNHWNLRYVNKSRKRDDINPVRQVIFRELSAL